ncbi:MAG: conjugative relaxase-like TrwC/TraI family protein [Colwellia sp.]|jgi:conjugative relaxase-like TrwC/TraI family protein
MTSLCAISFEQIDYYDELAEEDYYNNGGEPPGVWLGRAAPLLGLSGQVESADFRKLMQGYSPSGEPLCQNPGEGHKAGLDWTSSPPKSVSVALARAEGELKEQLRQALFDANKATIRHLEEHAAYTRRGHQGCIHEPVVALVAASYEHSTSRCLDVQYHHHNIIANVAPRTDGSWATIETRYLFLWQRSATAFYRAELAYRLMQLGFVLEPDGDAFHIVGIPKHVCKHFSKRAQDIKAELNKAGIASSSSAAGDFIKLDTRTKKQQVNRAELTERWHREMDERGFTLDDLEQLIEHPPKQIELPASAFIFDEQSILEVLSERQAVFRKQDIYQTACELAQFSGENTTYVNDIVKTLLADEQMVSLGQDHKRNILYTTQGQLRAERSLVDAAKALRSREDFVLNVETIEHVIEQAEESGFKLSDEQLEAVLDLCAPNAFATLQGAAGSGKTVLQQIVSNTYKKHGFKVIGAAVSKQAADTLATETGMKTFTLAKLLNEIEQRRKPLNDKTVLVVDEAGLLNSHDLAKLLKAASFARCKVILSGEDKQLDAISHGGALRYLSQPEVLGTSRIETIRRQRKSWAKASVMALRNGQAIKALQAHKERGLVHFANDNDAAKTQLVKHWQQYRETNPDKQAVVLAQSWKEVRALCEELRTIYQQDGLVGDENVAFECFVSDKIMRFNFSMGERIRLTKNDYRKGLFNGTLGTITALEKLNDGSTRFTIETLDGKALSFTDKDYCDPYGRLYMAQAYAMTVYSSQGLSVDGDVFLLHNTGMDRATSYVAGSRHKDNCHWFFNQTSIENTCNNGESLTQDKALEAVSTLMSQDRYKYLAIEYIEKQEVQNTVTQTIQPLLETEVEMDI